MENSSQDILNEISLYKSKIADIEEDRVELYKKKSEAQDRYTKAIRHELELKGIRNGARISVERKDKDGETLFKIKETEIRRIYVDFNGSDMQVRIIVHPFNPYPDDDRPRLIDWPTPEEIKLIL